MAVFMYAFLLVPTERYPVGILNRDGYEAYGVISGGVILLAILVSSAGYPSSHWLTQRAATSRAQGRQSGICRGD